MTDRASFLENLSPAFRRIGGTVEELLLREYGSVLVARGGAVPPPTIIFTNDEEVAGFQRSVASEKRSIGGCELKLQSAAMNALVAACDRASSVGLMISPRGPDSAARSYADTVALWASRVEPALEHWLVLGKVSSETAAHIRSLEPFDQVPDVLALESRGIWFAKDLSKSIIYSVAPPGASQHLSMLAVDIEQFNDPNVRQIMYKHGWFQTVTSDLPHFTFLGMREDELSRVGLKMSENAGRPCWVPDI